MVCIEKFGVKQTMVDFLEKKFGIECHRFINGCILYRANQL